MGTAGKKIETSYNFLVQATLYPNSNLRSVTASVNIMAFKHGVINRHCGKSKCIQITIEYNSPFNKANNSAVSDRGGREID